MILRSFGVGSVAKMLGVLYAIMGLVFGGIVSIVALVTTALSPERASAGMGAFGLFFGVAAVLVLPIVYGVLGVVFGAISALLYNLIARFVGGIVIDLEPEKGEREGRQGATANAAVEPVVEADARP